MFFLGFTGFYACITILCIICRVVRKFSDRFLVAAKKIKTLCCAFVFTIFSYIFTLVYSMLSIVSGDMLISAALCAIFLVFSWWMVNWLYKLMTGEHESKEKQNKVLEERDKNLCNLVSLMGTILSGAVMCYDNKNKEYVILISTAIGILIGTYIPISDIYKGCKIKDIVIKIWKEFKNEKKEVLGAMILACIVIVIFTFRGGIIDEIKTIVDQVGYGVTVGSILWVLGVTILDSCKNK